MAFDPDAVRAFEHAGWERAASSYADTFAVASRQFIDGLLDSAGVGAGQTVLDVACGPGFVAAAACERGATARGLDFSAAMLRQAQARYPAARYAAARYPAVRFEQGDAEALPFADAVFDAVVSNFGIHHVPRPSLALREAHRVTRPGGRVAFTIWAAPDRNIAWKLLFDAIGRCGDPAASDAPAPGGGFSTPAHCLAALRDAGFAGAGTRPLSGTWHHRDAASLVAALQAGTARMSALITAQDRDTMPGILADIKAHAAQYRDARGIAVPIGAVVASGVRA